MKKSFLLPILAALPPLLVLSLVAAGQIGLLRSTRPADIGVNNGLLKAPGAQALNVVSSQALRHPHTGYHVIAPLKFSGDPAAAFVRLQKVVASMAGARIIVARPDYLYAEYATRILKFVDDVEFLLDAEHGEIQMRSASRLGLKDFGANRARLEQVRAAFALP